MLMKKGHGDCATCGAQCCRYVVVELDKPTTRLDREEIRWFLAHENVVVFIDSDDGSWNVQFNTPCTHLDADNHCTIYRRRYDICRDYDTENCEASDGEVSDTIFRTPDDFDRWYRNQQARRRRKRKKKEAKARKKKAEAHTKGRKGA